MLNLNNGSVGLIGYGVSNKALCKYLMGKGIYPTVHAPTSCSIPKGMSCVFGEGYLDNLEETVFRSPGVHPGKIGKKSYTEVEYGFDLIDTFKVGITGSDGKTTTSTLVYLMLMRGGKNTFLAGNIGKPVIEIAPLVRAEDFLVCELSSFQLYGFEPCLDVGVITNISENHLDWHADMDDYINAKKNILAKSKRRVLNFDCPIVKEMAKDCTTYFSLRDCSSYLGNGHDFVHVVGGAVYYNEALLFFVKDVCLKGEFNLQNILCATAVAYPIVGKEAVERVAREFCGVENRMEQVCQIDGVTYICSAIDTTPERTRKTLSAFDISKVVPILGGSHKGLSYDCLGDVLQNAKAVILCGANSEMIRKSLNRQAIKVNTLEEAVNVAKGLCDHGDFVILTPASASFDMFENYKEKAKCFKNVVRGLR